MAAPIKEVAEDSSERNRAFIKHTLLYYINDIDSGKHNQPRESPPPPAIVCPALCVYVCVCMRVLIPRARTRARSFHCRVPSLDSRNERFLINIGRRLFFARVPFPATLIPPQPLLIYTLMSLLIFRAASWSHRLMLSSSSLDQQISQNNESKRKPLAVTLRASLISCSYMFLNA